jgi:hypothetical protein
MSTTFSHATVAHSLIHGIQPHKCNSQPPKPTSCTLTANTGLAMVIQTGPNCGGMAHTLFTRSQLFYAITQLLAHDISH